MISIENLVKRHGAREVLHGVSLQARPGRVTGFVGPNGAGKSSTLRCLLGLDRVDGGRALIGGRPYRELREPLRTVGAVLDGPGAHPSRTARGHLGWVASGAGISRRRVAEVLDVVGLSDAARQRVRTFSLGMGQRLELAAGDPDAPARLGDVGVIGLYVGTTGIVVLAVSVVVSEYASDPRTSGASSAPRQVATTMLVQPRRGASVAAKLLVVLGAATVLLATAWAGTFALCRHLLGSSVPFEPVPWWMLTGILTWWVFSAMASMALAMATRSALVSMTVLVAMSTMISPGVLLIRSTDAARFLPDTAAVRLIASPTTLNYDRLVELLSIPMAAAVCAAWAGGCAAVCCWVWMRRDA